MEMNNGKTMLILLSLNKTEFSMSLCFAHAGNIVRNVDALSFVMHFSIKKALFEKNYDQRIAMHISENMKELYFRRYLFGLDL